MLKFKNAITICIILYIPFNDAETACLGNETHIETKTPTLYPHSPFNAAADAAVLRKAMYGFGTDEDAIISILPHRTRQQRLVIAEKFKEAYGKDLLKDLKSETSGDFKRLIVAMMLPPSEYYAQELRNAMKGDDTDEDALIEILCTKSSHEVLAIKRAYQTVFGNSLEQDLISRTSSTAQRLMISLCNVCRVEDDTVNPTQAKADAATLARIGILNLGVDHSVLNNILYQRNQRQLELTFQEYQTLTGHHIETIIRNEFAVSRTIKNQAAFFARFLRSCMKGATTRDGTLMRLIVTRSEIDMVEIKREYESKYGESLADAIKDDTSGDYETCLLALVGENDS